MPPVREHSLARGPLSSANSENGKDKAPSAPAPAPPTDPATWRESRIPPGELITSAQAKKWYNIQRSDYLNEISWEPYPCVDTKSKKQLTLVLLFASHREIERKAWEKHGGPEGWDEAYQNYRRQQQNSKRRAKLFPEPIINKPSSQRADGRQRLNPKTPPDDLKTNSPLSVKNPHVTNANLERLYKRFISRFHSPWVWEKCNVALTATCVLDESIRESHLENALVTLPRYPIKPQAMRLPREDFRRPVLDVLNKAPLRADIGTGAIRSSSGGILWDWGVPYLTDLYEVLNETIDEHGRVGWRKLRWMVYHRYEKSHGGIYLNSYDGTWSDPAFKWLAGKAEPGSLIYAERSRCQAGIEYNERLPVDYA